MDSLLPKIRFGLLVAQDVSGAAVSLVIVDNGQIYVGGSGDDGDAESAAMGEVVRWTADENPHRKLLVLTSSILVSMIVGSHLLPSRAGSSTSPM